MSRSTVQVLERPKSSELRPELLQALDAENEDMDVDSAEEEEEEGDELEKDETEVELERLVFGDSSGFREGLKDFAPAEREDDGDAERATGLEGLDDADVGQALTLQ